MNPETQTAYDTWTGDPSPANLHGVVSGMDGTIHHVLRSIGAEGDPYLLSEARVLAAGAVKSYDPTAASSLPTWVSTQLQPLRRLRRQAQTPLQVPDRAQLDAMTLHHATQAFMDTHDREPDLAELADASGLPVRRIRVVRETLRPTPSEGAYSGIVLGNQTDFREEAMDYVYDDSDRIDRKIIEMRTGYGGNTPITPGEAAAKLNLTPVQISRRSAKIAAKVLEIEKALEK